MTIRMFLAAALSFTCLAAAGRGQITGTSQNVLFSGSNSAQPAADQSVVAPDGSFIATIGTNASVADVVITLVDRTGTVTGQQNVNFPQAVNVSTANSGLVVDIHSRFCVCLGSGGLGDLVVIRPNSSGVWEGVLVDYPGGSAPAIDTRPAISPDGRYVVSLGAGTSNDLVFTPITVDSQGVIVPGSPIGISFPSSNNVPQITGVRPVTSFNGNAVAVPGTLTAGDIVVCSVPNPFAAAGLSATNVSYASSNSIPDVAVPVLISPDGTWCATFGQATLGDVVVTALNSLGAPTATQNVLFPSSNNAASTSASMSSDPRGRVIAVNGTIAAGDLVLVPVSSAGQPGTAVNIAYPSSNLIPAGSPAATFAPTGRYVVTAGTGTIGDFCITTVAYNSSTNTVTGTPVNVLFPGANDRRSTSAAWSISSDGAFVATLGQNATIGDLVIAPVDVYGVPGAAINVAYPNAINAPTFQGAPAIDPRADFVVTAGDDILGDLVITSIGRDANCLASVAATASTLFVSSNNLLTTTAGPVIAPSGQFVKSLGSPTIGDLVVTPIVDARVFSLAPARIGEAVVLRFRSPADAGRGFLAAASLNRCPGIALGDGRIFELTNDFVFLYSLAPQPTFYGMSGTLDSDGIGEALFVVPNLPDARGLPFYFAFAVLNPSASLGIGTLSRPGAVVLE